MFSFVRCLTVAVLTVPLPACAALLGGLGPAEGYNTFVLGDLSRSNSDSWGPIAVGGNASFSSFSVGSRVTSGTGLVVGGTLQLTGGDVGGNAVLRGDATLNNPTFKGTLDVAGNVAHTNWGSVAGVTTIGGNFTSPGFGSNRAFRVGGTLSITGSGNFSAGLDVRGAVSIANPSISGGLRSNSSVAFTGGGGSVSPGVTFGTTYTGPSYITRTQAANAANVPAPAASPVDFAAAADYLTSASDQWGDLAPTGSHTLQWSTRTLTGSRADLNVFSLSANDFTGVSTFSINVPAGSTVLINVSGSSVTLPNIGWTLNGKALGSESSGADFASLLWNLPEATTLRMHSLGGSVLAPNAAVSFDWAQHNGTLVARSLTGTGESHHFPFAGQLPAVSTGGGGSGGVVPEPAALSLLAPALILLRRHRR